MLTNIGTNSLRLTLYLRISCATCCRTCKSELKMRRSLLLAMPFVTGAVSRGFYESLTGLNTLGDHFGYPAFANATYDYIIVGGGTAGLAVASKLTEAGVGTVAVIEAGGFYELDNGNLSSIPGTAGYFIGTEPLERNPLIDWEYQTEPNPVSTERSSNEVVLET